MYDCGTSSSSESLSYEFAVYKDRSTHFSAHPEVDFLFLSHFHEDHVSGLSRLVRAHVTVGHIFAPLVSPTERLLAFASSDDPLEPSELQFFLELIADPGEALSQVAGRVTLVSPGAAGQEATPFDSDTDKDIPDPSTSPTFSAETPTSSSNEITDNWLRATTTISTADSTPIWVLEPYVLQQLEKNDGHKAFRSELRKELRLSVEGLEKKLSSPQELLKLISTVSARSKIRKAYHVVLKARKLNRDLNLTSLSLYAGPARRASRTWRSRWPMHEVAPAEHDKWIDRREVGAWTLQAGWLHTGDASLKHDGRCHEFLAFFARRLHLVGAFLLPHHGADSSFDSRLLPAMSSIPLCIAPSKPGFGRGWVHPGNAVVGDLSAHGNHMVVVSHSPESRYTDTLTLEF